MIYYSSQDKLSIKKFILILNKSNMKFKLSSFIFTNVYDKINRINLLHNILYLSFLYTPISLISIYKTLPSN